MNSVEVLHQREWFLSVNRHAVEADSTAERMQEAASRAFAPLRVRPFVDVGFEYSFDSAAAGEIVVTRIVSGPCSVRRPRKLITSTDPELVKISLHASGRGGVEQDGRQCLLKPGDLVSYVTERPYELRFWEPAETVVISVPRALLGVRADVLDRHTAVPVPTDSGARRAVAGFMRTLSEVLDTAEGFTGGAWRGLTDAVVSMALPELAGLPADRDADLADRILAYCRTRLPDPELSVASVAGAHGISVRHLHKIFESREFTLSAWIRRTRLERIRSDLADPRLSGRTVAAIAARWGILSAPHLSRALKAEFGSTAAEIRRTASADTSSPPR